MRSFCLYLGTCWLVLSSALLIAAAALAEDTRANAPDLRLVDSGSTGVAWMAARVTVRSNDRARRPLGPETLWRVFDHQESDTPFVTAVAAPMTGRLILVRHADRDPNETDLNAVGVARAEALPTVLEDLPLDAIYIPDLRRNADTAAALASQRGLSPQVREPDASLAAFLAQAAEGQSVIWIGNVGNLSQLWDTYRLPGPPPIEYGQIAVLTADAGIWRVTFRTVAP